MVDVVCARAVFYECTNNSWTNRVNLTRSLLDVCSLRPRDELDQWWQITIRFREDPNWSTNLLLEIQWKNDATDCEDSINIDSRILISQCSSLISSWSWNAVLEARWRKTGLGGPMTSSSKRLKTVNLRSNDMVALTEQLLDPFTVYCCASQDVF